MYIGEYPNELYILNALRNLKSSMMRKPTKRKSAKSREDQKFQRDEGEAETTTTMLCFTK